MELTIAVVIMGIFAAISLPLYNRVIERSRDQEAITNLGLIKSAQLIYYSERRTFFGPQAYDGGASSANESELNTRLYISLPTVLPLAWDYFIVLAGPTPPSFTALAFRNGGGFSRSYTITQNTNAVCASSNCP